LMDGNLLNAKLFPYIDYVKIRPLMDGNAINKESGKTVKEG